MADINFNCPFCSQNFDAPEDMAGEDVDCPKCNNQIKVPFPQMADAMPEPEAAFVPEAPIPEPPVPQPVQQMPVQVEVRIPVNTPAPAPAPEPVMVDPVMEELPVSADQPVSSIPAPVVQPPVSAEPAAPVKAPVGPAGFKKGIVGKPAFGKKPTLGGGMADAIAKKQAAFAASKALGTKTQTSPAGTADKQPGAGADKPAVGDTIGDVPVKVASAVPAAGAGTSKLAIGSLVSAILGISPVAIICGHMSISRIKKAEGALKGKGLAIVGLVLGYLQILALIVTIAVIAVGLSKAKDEIVEGIKKAEVQVSEQAVKTSETSSEPVTVDEVKTDTPAVVDSPAVEAVPEAKAEEPDTSINPAL